MMDPFTPKEGYGQEIFAGITRKVIRLDEHRVLKRGGGLNRETDALQFVAANSTIPVPKVHETRYIESTHGFEIVMEYMPGEPLEEVWSTLNDAQKVSTCQQLNGYLSQLQTLKGKRIEGINGAPVTVGLRYPREGGPFDTEKEFNDFMLEGIRIHLPDVTKYYLRAGLTDDHEIHFAHGDFAPRNILVDENGKVTAVLDWEKAGFYPEYWDLNRMYCDPPQISRMPGYRDHFHHITPYKYVQEVLAMRFLLIFTN